MPATYVPIASQILSSTASSVTFSNIPQTYTDLVLRCSIRVNNASNSKPIAIRFNGTNGTSTLYSWRTLIGRGNAGPANAWQSNFDTWDAGEINDAVSTSNTFGSVDIYIPNYTSATSKPLSSFVVEEDNVVSYAFITATAGLFRNTSAITSLSISNPTGYATYNIVAGSSFHLYGIKNT